MPYAVSLLPHGVSLCSLPFPLHALALILLFLAKVPVLPTLTLSHLMIWYFGQMARFLFLLAKAALAYLPTALFVALKPLFPFQQTQYVQVFPLEPAPFWKLFAGLGSTNKSAISLFFSYYLTIVVLFSIFFLYLKLYGRSFRNCLLSPLVLSGYKWSPDTRFSRGTMRLMNWPNGERYLHLLQSLVVSLRSSLVSILVFFRTGGVLSHRNSLTHRFPRFPPRNSCSLAVFYLVFAATDTAFS